jgi:hypothetical protein
MKWWLIIIPIPLILAGCAPQASKMSIEDSMDAVQSLRYVHDERTGECFAVVASRHQGELNQNGFTITWVPCSPGVMRLLRGDSK